MENLPAECVPAVALRTAKSRSVSVSLPLRDTRKAPLPPVHSVPVDWHSELQRYAHWVAPDSLLDVSTHTIPLAAASAALLGLTDDFAVRGAALLAVQRSPLLQAALGQQSLFGAPPPVQQLAISMAFRRDFVVLRDGCANRIGWGFPQPPLVVCCVGAGVCAVRGILRETAPLADVYTLLGAAADEQRHKSEVAARQRAASRSVGNFCWQPVNEAVAAPPAPEPVPPAARKRKEPVAKVPAASPRRARTKSTPKAASSAAASAPRKREAVKLSAAGLEERSVALV